MWIHDLTAFLEPLFYVTTIDEDKYDHFHHAFNPSIMHWKDDLYLVVCRVILFRVLRNKNTRPIWLHPWKMWDNGHKYFHSDPDRTYRMSFPETQFKKGGKYRETVSSPDFVIHLTSDVHCPYNLTGEREIDSTAIGVLRYNDNKWSSYFPFRFLFEEMNQDARLHRVGDSFFISYNTFTRNDNQTATRMVYRPFLFLNDDMIYFMEERSMVHPDIARPVEKNCVFFGNDVLYSITFGDCFIQRNDKLLQMNQSFNLWKTIYSYTRSYDATFALGTNLIPYKKNRSLMVGHAKIPFRQLLQMREKPSSITKWVDSIIPEFETVYQHGKFIYYMFLVEFDSTTCDITRVSHAFIPTNPRNPHSPYLLVFPCGLCYGRNEEEILISYGEGDVRTKVLSLTTDDVENLLRTEDDMRTDIFDPQSFAYRFDILNTDQWNASPRIFHFGYFYEDNAGDDQYMIMFRLLRNHFVPHYHCYFRNKVNQYQDKEIRKQDIIIFGGGDIVNPFFLDPLQQYIVDRKKHAVSIGMPYLSYESSLSVFDSVSLRNILDLERAKTIIPNVVSYPDVAFLLPLIRPTVPRSLVPNKLVIGVSFPRTWYQRDSLHYISFLQNMCKVFQSLIETNPSIKFILVPFCIRRFKSGENDIFLNRQIQTILNDPSHVDSFVPKSNYFEYMWDIDRQIMENVDFMICGRFHSHIFSINRQIPFVSMTTSRKCEQMMNELQHQSYTFSFKKNADDCPIFTEDDIPSTIAFLQKALDDRDMIRDRIEQYRQKNILPRLQDFLTYYKNIVFPTDDTSTVPTNDLADSPPDDDSLITTTNHDSPPDDDSPFQSN